MAAILYFDNAATSLQKPPGVANTLCAATGSLGNAGRSFYTPALEAARAIHAARASIAGLVGLQNPLAVAFTSGATESLNLAIASLIKPGDGVITTVLEHNAVLRPLYASGAKLSFIGCDDTGRLLLEQLHQKLTPATRFVVCGHGSNLVGSVADVCALHSFCRENGLIFILDAAQTLGSIPVRWDMADLICFTGHKGLLGPQGTGGIVAPAPLPWRIPKTGGTGSDSFALHQPAEMPGVYEAGTANAPGLAALTAAVEYIARRGVDDIAHHEQALTRRFVQQLQGLPGLTLYGSPGAENTLPVVALNLEGWPAEELALRLWEGWEIATRPGSHCAPLAHERFGTRERGMLRFSFGPYNTPQEIDTAANALRSIAIGDTHA